MALSKKNVTMLIVILVVAVIVIFKLFLSSKAITMDPVEARIKGPETAKVNIIEFLDFECPACAWGAGKLKVYMQNHPNDIRLQIKYYPLMNMHHHALQAASYMECVSRQGKFWPFFDTIMDQQPQWSRLVNVEGVFDQVAQNSSVNISELKECLKKDDVSATIMSEKALGRSMGVESTPTYFINKKMVVGGKSMTEELDRLLPKEDKK